MDWTLVGRIGVVSFALAIAAILIARRWFQSKDYAKAQLGAKILATLGGVRTLREVTSELERRFKKQEVSV